MVAESISQAELNLRHRGMVRRGDATNFPNGGFPLGRTPPNPENTPALFAMATRPIRQPPATKTDLPCVPRLIFLLSASSLVLSYSCDRSLCLRAVPFVSSLFFLLVSFAHTRLYIRKARRAGERSCRAPLPLSISAFHPFSSRSFSLSLRLHVFLYAIKKTNTSA